MIWEIQDPRAQMESQVTVAKIVLSSYQFIIGLNKIGIGLMLGELV